MEEGGLYYGDVDVIVRMRYRVDAQMPLHPDTMMPNESDVLRVLREHTFNDVTDTEELEVLAVGRIGPNCADPSQDEE